MGSDQSSRACALRRARALRPAREPFAPVRPCAALGGPCSSAALPWPALMTTMTTSSTTTTTTRVSLPACACRHLGRGVIKGVVSSMMTTWCTGKSSARSPRLFFELAPAAAGARTRTLSPHVPHSLPALANTCVLCLWFSHIAVSQVHTLDADEHAHHSVGILAANARGLVRPLAGHAVSLASAALRAAGPQQLGASLCCSSFCRWRAAVARLLACACHASCLCCVCVHVLLSICDAICQFV